MEAVAGVVTSLHARAGVVGTDVQITAACVLVRQVREE